MKPLFRSTNNRISSVPFSVALLQGQAPDLGLFFPESIPRLGNDWFKALSSKTYAEIAADVLTVFVDLPDSTVRDMTEQAYNFDVPIEKISGNRFLTRLDQGPTCSFKDFAARFMARSMSYLLEKKGERAIILTATSGDTGSAVASAFQGLSGIDVIILYPEKEVSERQRKQMTTIGRNTSVFAVNGKFDDCQKMVRTAFSDPALERIPLSSANSINIGRLLPQSVYYMYSWSRTSNGNKCIFSVPCGNFGNLTAGLIAYRLGLPVEFFIAATNENDEFPLYLENGEYKPVVPSRKCLSTAMNVGHPSNLARLVALFGGSMDERGIVISEPDLSSMKNTIRSSSISDSETREAIKKVYNEFHTVIEPHGAVGWSALQKICPDVETNIILLETAHPSKFPDEIKSILGFEPEVAKQLSCLEDRNESYERIGTEYDEFRKILIQSY